MSSLLDSTQTHFNHHAILVLYCIVLHCIVWYLMLSNSIARYCMLLHCWLRCAGCVLQDAYVLKKLHKYTIDLVSVHTHDDCTEHQRRARHNDEQLEEENFNRISFSTASCFHFCQRICALSYCEVWRGGAWSKEARASSNAPGILIFTPLLAISHPQGRPSLSLADSGHHNYSRWTKPLGFYWVVAANFSFGSKVWNYQSGIWIPVRIWISSK